MDDRELMAQIMKIRKELEANNVPYEKQMEALRSLMPILDSKQKARLSKIIEMMKQ